MNFLLSLEKTLSLITPGVSLHDAQPVLNGVPVEYWDCEMIRLDDEQAELRYTAPSLAGGAFWIQVTRSNKQHLLWMRYWIEHLPDDLLLESFGICFRQVENLRQYLRNGYFSWDGSYYVQPEALIGLDVDTSRLERGYAMTQMLPRYGSGALVLGFDRHDRFQQTFDFGLSQPFSLTIQTLWDRKERYGLERCESERLAVFSHEGCEQGLREWAHLVAGASPARPRIPEPPITGWCSWYNLYGYINDENILEHLQAAETVVAREHLPMRVFQIDDGFTPEMGDWLDVKPQFPRGIKPLLDDIRSAGFIPGLWIAPFLVGNRSRLYGEHPDWVVKERRTGGPLTQMRFYGEFRWHKRSEEYYILDATHPEAFDYLRSVFRTWRQEWGCEYFKTDFMHFGSEHGPDTAVWYVPGRTRIEIWRRMAEMIREELGEALWLGCGCPLWASVGLVDSVRIGRDVGVTWSGELSAQSLLRDQACRNFANQILWQSDPDCVLLRERFSHLSEAEIKTLAVYAGMSGGVMMTSDHLGELSPQRLRLWQLILSETRASCDFPLLGQTGISYERLPAGEGGDNPQPIPRADDPVLVQVRRPARAGVLGAIFIVNTSARTLQRTYHLADLGIDGAVFLYSWESQATHEHALEQVAVTLPGHDSALYFFSTEPIEDGPLRLPAR